MTLADVFALAAQLLDHLGRLLEAGQVEVPDDNLGAELGEPDGHESAQAGSAAGDEHSVVGHVLEPETLGHEEEQDGLDHVPGGDGETLEHVCEELEEGADVGEDRHGWAGRLAGSCVYSKCRLNKLIGYR